MVLAAKLGLGQKKFPKLLFIPLEPQHLVIKCLTKPFGKDLISISFQELVVFTSAYINLSVFVVCWSSRSEIQF